MPPAALPIDIADATARTLDGRIVYFRESEIEILKPLIADFGKLLRWEDLIEAIWGPDPEGGPLHAKGLVQARLRQLSMRMRDTGLRFRFQRGLGVRLMWWSDDWIAAKRAELGLVE